MRIELQADSNPTSSQCTGDGLVWQNPYHYAMIFLSPSAVFALPTCSLSPIAQGANILLSGI
jgi:hypothetical protein